MRFISRYRGHRIQMLPSRRQERDGIVYVQVGHCIEFEDGRYEASDEKEIEYLQNHPDFGVHIFADQAPAPTSRGQRRSKKAADAE